VEGGRVADRGYRGRIAPTPTGYLHLGHAATFWTAADRCRLAGGELIFRLEDLDPQRCRPEYADAALDDLRWLGINWQEGPDVGGPYAPYVQSERRSKYLAAWEHLRDHGFIYPSHHSRKEISTLAPHEEEPIFPVDWRNDESAEREGVNWRFRVPDDEIVSFLDGQFGPVQKTALKDFGDFQIWNRDDIPAYELAVVVDDIAMGITEVVRGADLLTSTARQILLYRALGAEPPLFYHCPLATDERGIRLAKRQASLSLRAMRDAGRTPLDCLTEAFRRIS
jgi:glutamyl/glutaminyl-tRNA synthetase